MYNAIAIDIKIERCIIMLTDSALFVSLQIAFTDDSYGVLSIKNLKLSKT